MQKRISALVGTGLMALGLSIAGPQQSQIPAEYQDVLTYLGRAGDLKSGVLKVNVPRNDLQVTVHGVPSRRPSDSAAGWP